MPTPSGRTSRTLSYTSTRAPISRRLSAVTRPPMPAPTTMIRSSRRAMRQRTSWTWIRTVSRRRSPVDTAMRSFIHARRGAEVDSLTWVRK